MVVDTRQKMEQGKALSLGRAFPFFVHYFVGIHLGKSVD